MLELYADDYHLPQKQVGTLNFSLAFVSIPQLLSKYMSVHQACIIYLLYVCQTLMATIHALRIQRRMRHSLGLQGIRVQWANK